MITKAALLVFREAPNGKELLFVRPHGKDYYIFPGGKQELDETIGQALGRELDEELGVGLDNVQYLGEVQGETPDGRALNMQLFTGSPVGELRPRNEIAEVRWLGQLAIQRHTAHMTPMTLNHVLPFLDEQRLW